MDSLLSLVSPHSAAELSSPDPSLTSARSQQLLKESRKCNLRNDPSYPGWFHAMKALRSFLFPLRSFLVPILPLSLKSMLDLQNLCSRGHWMHWTGGNWSLLLSPHFLVDIEAKVLQVLAGIGFPVPNPHLPFQPLQKYTCESSLRIILVGIFSKHLEKLMKRPQIPKKAPKIKIPQLWGELSSLQTRVS